MSFSMDDAAYGEAARGLGLVVRLDSGRPAGFPPWTVAIQGVGRGDAGNPHAAAEKLREALLDLARDAEEGKLARARLEKAREAWAALDEAPPWQASDAALEAWDARREAAHKAIDSALEAP